MGRNLVNLCHAMKTVNASYAAALQRFIQGDKGAKNSIEVKELRVALALQDEVWRGVSHRFGPEAGVRFGLGLTPSDLGSFGHLLLSLPTLGDVLLQLARFYPLIGEGGVLEVRRGAMSTRILYRPLYQVARTLRVEAVLSTIMAIARHLSDAELYIEQLVLDYLPAPEVRHLLDGLCGELKVQQDYIGLAVTNAALAYPLPQGNRAVSQCLTALLQQELDSLPGLGVARAVQSLLWQSPHLNRHQVAEALYLSERTLCRRLAAQGKSFAGLRQACLTELANEALANQRSVGEVADILGYCDVSAFVKAYKRWTGKTPKNTKYRFAKLPL